jgi:drug/metabolite transporter (DMT)-like permease
MAGARTGAGRGQAVPIAVRTLAATAGAYAASYALAAALARLLPLPRSEAVILSSMLGIVAMVGFAIWAFAERSLPRLGAGLALVVAAGTIIAKGHLP